MTIGFELGRRWLSLLVLAAATLSACSGGNASADGGHGGTGGAAGTTGSGGQSGRGGTGGAGGACASAVANGTCAPEGAVCGSCTDPCQFCNSLHCQGGHWQTQEAAPAPCFDCGNGSTRCQLHADYCQLTTGRGSSSGACVALPDACQPTPTCACVSSQSNCSEADGGGLTVTILAP